MTMRCPFRVTAFDQPDTCDPSCAWLVFLTAKEGERLFVCATAFNAINGSEYDVGIVNALKESEVLE